MRSVIVYKPVSEYARAVEDYLRDFERQTGRQPQILDPETPDGADFCRAYDIVEYPTVIALDDSGIMQNIWRGMPLPTISELSYYV